MISFQQFSLQLLLTHDFYLPQKIFLQKSFYDCLNSVQTKLEQTHREHRSSLHSNEEELTV